MAIRSRIWVCGGLGAFLLAVGQIALAGGSRLEALPAAISGMTWSYLTPLEQILVSRTSHDCRIAVQSNRYSRFVKVLRSYAEFDAFIENYKDESSFVPEVSVEFSSYDDLTRFLEDPRAQNKIKAIQFHLRTGASPQSRFPMGVDLLLPLRNFQLTALVMENLWASPASQGSTRLAEIISAQPHLKTLDLKGAISWTSKKYLTFEESNAVRDWGNGVEVVDPSEFRPIFEAMKNLTELRHLDLSEIPLGSANGLTLSEILPLFPKLEFLSLRKTRIGDAVGQALKAALPQLPYLRHLDLSGHLFTSEGLTHLDAALQEATLERERPLDSLEREPSFQNYSAQYPDEEENL